MSEANEMDIDIDDAVRPYPTASQELSYLRARLEKAERDAERYRKYRNAVISLQGGPTAQEFDADIDTIDDAIAKERT